MTAYAIPRLRFDRLADEVSRLNRRADRLGVAPLRFATTGAEWCTFARKVNQHTGQLEVVQRREVVEVELEGGSIRLPGWTFCGTLEHLGAAGDVILRAVPGETIPETYRTATKACDHCGLDRQRNDTFVVRSDAGEFRQVGRSCTADYLGSVDPQRLASWLEAVHEALATGGDEDDDGYGSGGRGLPDSYRPDEVVAVAEGSIRAFGYRKAAETASTKGIVQDWLSGGREWRKLVERGMEVTAEDYDRAQAAVEWATSQGGNDYLANLATYARQERVGGRAVGLLASLPVAYARALGQIAEQRARETQRAEAQPAPSGRVAVEGTVVGLKEQSSYYGGRETVTTKVTLLTAEGWRMWATLPAAIADAQIGDVVRLTATVEPSTDDPTFAFGKRPAKAEIVTSAKED